MFSLFCVCSNFVNAVILNMEISMTYTGFKQAVYGILFLVGAPHEYVNT